MLERVFNELGPWNWMVLGFLLLILELVLPGVFLLWIGIAALVTGALSLALWDAGVWTWQAQVLAFLLLSVAAVLAGRRIMASRPDESDQPLLNQRGAQLIGRTAILTEPIREGRGRVHLDDTVWIVSGPNLPAGSRVRVVGGGDSELMVEAAPTEV